MATPATDNPIAPASVAIEVQPNADPEETAKGNSAVKGCKPTKTYRQEDYRPDYKVICCGNSCLDLILVPLTAIVLYGALIGLSLLVLWAAFLTSTSGAANWIYFFAWFTGVVILSISVSVAEHEIYLKKQMLKKQEAEGTNA